MADITWYFDFISPFSYLHWQKVRALRDRHAVTPVPIVFAAILSACGQKGPAEIPGKREFTYQYVLWQSRREGVPLRFPPAHPFNPILALRACIAAGSTAEAVDAIFDWIWRDGRGVESVDTMAPLLATLGVAPERLSDGATKSALRANTDAALAAGVYGVPTLAFDGRLFWGNDAHDFAMAVLRDPGVMDEAEMRRATALPVGIVRSG